jgi:outer membrane protein OmpA-like peptidoglycan-associated protein
MKYLILFAWLFSVNVLYAQDTLLMRYGLAGGLSLNLHTADFRALPGVPNCCPDFQNGSGIGPAFAVSAAQPLDEQFSLGLRAGYTSLSALLKEEQPVTVIAAGNKVDGAFEHTIDAILSTISLEPYLAYHLGGGLSFSIGLGAGMLLSKDFSQKETISKPDGVGTFLDSLGNDSRQRTRNENSGTLPDASGFLLHIIGGVSFDLPLNAKKTLYLVPELSYGIALSNVVSGTVWKPNNLRTMIGISYQPRYEPPKPKQYDTVYVRDTTLRLVAGLTKPGLKLLSRTFSYDEQDGAVILIRTTVTELYERLEPDNRLKAALEVFGVNDTIENRIARLRIEEFLSTNVQPLLNYIFFDNGSYQIPQRMMLYDDNAAQHFRPEQLSGKQTLDIYREMLNIIGYRLQQNPQAALTLTGCNSNEGIERDNLALSQERARMIADYLTRRWGIASNRITIEARNLPEKPSNPNTPDGIEENRRVEITSSTSEITDVFIINDTMRRSDPPTLRFKPTVTTVVPVEKWILTVMQNNKLLKTFHGNGIPPAVIDWDLQYDPGNMPRFDTPLDILFDAAATDGNTVSTSVKLPTEIITIRDKQESKKGDYRIDKFNLILFEFNRSDITSANKRIIDLVKSKIKPTSELLIEGFTDRTGDAASNERLATARAVSSRDALGRKDAQVKGIGERVLLYDNDSPEGRFYCRTVQITAKTPY